MGRVVGFSVGVVAFYALLLLPSLAMHRFNVSDFVVAGDRFVTADAALPIIIRHHSDGYDGQFYYRMAMGPLSFAPALHGVRFDKPAWRMQRIGLPVLTWVVTLGQARRAPTGLLLVNLLGIGAIAALGMLISARAGLPGWLPFALLLWPGFIVALSHDTTEIVATGFVLGAILCRVGGNRGQEGSGSLVKKRTACFVRARSTWSYGALAACAILTRETTLPVFAGFLLADLWGRRKMAALASAMAMLPYLAWRGVLLLAWPMAGGQGSVSQALGWPMVGAARMLVDCVIGARHWASTPMKDLILRGIVLVSAPALLGFCGLVAWQLIARWRGRRPATWRDPALAPLGVSWLLVAGLMSLLTAYGPWIDPAAYFRAFTECYVIGCLVLANMGWDSRYCVRIGMAGAAIFACIWVYCVVQLRMV